MNKIRWMLIFLPLYVLHLVLLSRTVFIGWPEMFIYPWLIHKGLVLYRDWLAMYTPGVAYLLAGFYNFLGYELASLTKIAYGVITISDILLFMVAVKIFHKWLPVVVTFLFYLLWHPVFEGNTLWFDSFLLPVTLLAFYFLVGYIKRPMSRTLITIAICLGMAFLFKQTALLLFVIVLGLVIFINRRWRKRMVHHAFLLIEIYSVLVGAVAITYFFLGLLKPFLYWTIVFPLWGARDNLYYRLTPSLWELRMVAPVFILVGLIGVFLLVYRKKYGKRLETWLAISLTAALAFLAYPRWGLFHLAPSLAFAALVVGLLTDLSSSFGKVSHFIFLLFIMLVIGGSAASFVYFTHVRSRSSVPYFHREILALAKTIDAQTFGQEFYVFGNYDFIYYYIDRKPTVKPWVQLFPAIAEAPGLQEALINSLENTQVPYVAYFPYHEGKAFYADYFPKKLGTFIFTHYERVGPLPYGGSLLKRKEL